MKFGVCTLPEQAILVQKAGFDFIELHVQRDLKTMDSDAIFAEALPSLKTASFPHPVANCFIPGNLKITGGTVSYPTLERYVAKALMRAQTADIDTIVFGSGGARNVPEGFSRKEAWEQLIVFGKMVGSIAERYDVTVVVEPLNRTECNILNTLDECAQYVNAVNTPYFLMLVDAYHWGVDNDSYSDIVKYGHLIRHVHIATYKSRRPPGLEPCDFQPFFTALREIQYDGRISVEARWDDITNEVDIVRRTLERYAF
jgi:sugar phosphate isomerase/epimerase